MGWISAAFGTSLFGSALDVALIFAFFQLACWARCVAGCWGGGHVKWCHEVAKLGVPGVSPFPFTGSSGSSKFEISLPLPGVGKGDACLVQKQKNTNLKKHKVAEILGAKLPRSQDAANPAVPSVTCYFCSKPVFEKNFEKNYSRPLPRILAPKLRRSRDAANPAVPSVTCYFCLEQKMRISKNTR